MNTNFAAVLQEYMTTEKEIIKLEEQIRASSAPFREQKKNYSKRIQELQKDILRMMIIQDLTAFKLGGYMVWLECPRRLKPLQQKLKEVLSAYSGRSLNADEYSSELAKIAKKRMVQAKAHRLLTFPPEFSALSQEQRTLEADRLVEKLLQNLQDPENVLYGVTLKFQKIQH